MTKFRGLTPVEVLADVPLERKPEGGYVRMFPWNENRNEATFAKTTLLRNRPFVGPATTQNLVVKLIVKLVVEFWWKFLLTIFPSK